MKPAGLTSGAGLRYMDSWAGVKYNSSCAVLTPELLQEACNRSIGEDMAGFGLANNAEIRIEKVKNGYIISIGYDKYVFRTLAQVNKAVTEYYSQPAKEEKED